MLNERDTAREVKSKTNAASVQTAFCYHSIVKIKPLSFLTLTPLLNILAYYQLDTNSDN